MTPEQGPALPSQGAEPAGASAGHVRGLLYVLLGGALYASAGLFTRGLPFSIFTLLAWRSLAGAVFLIALFAFEKRRLSIRDYALAPAHLILVPIGAVSTFCYVYALQITTVANVMIVYATTPFVTAIVAYLWVREVPSRRLVVASSIALLGVVIMLAGGPASAGSLLGTGLILFMNLSFALTLVLARRDPERSMAPVNALSLLVASAFGFAAAPAASVGIGSVLLMVLFGVATIGFAMPLFMAGARLAPASEVALIGISDVVLGPLMMWLVFREDPGTAAEIGGVVVMGALLWNIWPVVAAALAHRRGPVAACEASG